MYIKIFQKVLGRDCSIAQAADRCDSPLCVRKWIEATKQSKGEQIESELGKAERSNIE